MNILTTAVTYATVADVRDGPFAPFNLNPHRHADGSRRQAASAPLPSFGEEVSQAWASLKGTVGGLTTTLGHAAKSLAGRAMTVFRGGPEHEGPRPAETLAAAMAEQRRDLIAAGATHAEADRALGGPAALLATAIRPENAVSLDAAGRPDLSTRPDRGAPERSRQDHRVEAPGPTGRGAAPIAPRRSAP